jgi:hypothetical protein
VRPGRALSYRGRIGRPAALRLDPAFPRYDLHFLGTTAFPDWVRVLAPGGLAAFTLPWRDRFRPGPAFAELLPPAGQQITLPGSAAEASAVDWPGFDMVRLEPSEAAALFVLRKPM